MTTQTLSDISTLKPGTRIIDLYGKIAKVESFEDNGVILSMDKEKMHFTQEEINR